MSSLPDVVWDDIKARLNPDAWRDLVKMYAADDGPNPMRLDQVLAKAVELHNAYTGVTLSFTF